MDQILGSVGLGGKNFQTDVLWVQIRLNLHRSSISDAREITVDGIVGPGTINAIRAFQQFIVKLNRPDGLVELRGKTFQALANEPTMFVPPPILRAAGITVIEGLRFPFAKRPIANYHKDGTNKRYFGAPRNGGTRLHAGCDLLMPVGTEILAIADGTITGYSPHFYQKTQALEISHDCKLLARYCEIKGLASGIKVGSKVSRGQMIAYVGKLNSAASMLHFELYSNTHKGSLTVRDPSNPAIYKDKRFQRRIDLLDPTSYLDKAALS